MIDNLILNQSANKKLGPYRLIKKRAENKRTITKQSNSQLHCKHFIHCISGQTHKTDSSPKLNHSLTTQFKISQKHKIEKSTRQNTKKDTATERQKK